MHRTPCSLSPWFPVRGIRVSFASHASPDVSRVPPVHPLTVYTAFSKNTQTKPRDRPTPQKEIEDYVTQRKFAVVASQSLPPLRHILRSQRPFSKLIEHHPRWLTSVIDAFSNTSSQRNCTAIGHFLLLDLLLLSIHSVLFSPSGVIFLGPSSACRVPEGPTQDESYPSSRRILLSVPNFFFFLITSPPSPPIPSVLIVPFALIVRRIRNAGRGILVWGFE